jgi:hypothetical protein
LKIDLPPLAHFRRIDQYATPKYGDFVIWQGLFKTAYGVVNDYDAASGLVSIITEATPRLLFTMNQDEMGDRTHIISLNDMHRWKRGHFYVMQEEDGKPVWYS